MNFCINCKNYRNSYPDRYTKEKWPGVDAWCGAGQDLIDGRKLWEPCQLMRMPLKDTDLPEWRHCAPEGRLFEWGE